MDRTPVASSNLQSVGYDEEASMLEIAFWSGSVYQYSGVPRSVYEELMGAGSKGQYLNDFVKDIYPYTQIG